MFSTIVLLLNYVRAVKIDFEAVAKETGYSNPRSASNRLAALKKGTTSTTAASGSSDKATKRKPGRQKGASSKKAKKGAESDEKQSGGEGRDQEDGEEDVEN